MQKIVINKCYGGFGLSEGALAAYRIAGGTTKYEHEIKRDDPILVQVVEELGGEADTAFSQLTVVEIPDRVKWSIEEYDGMEWIAEKHRTWR